MFGRPLNAPIRRTGKLALVGLLLVLWVQVTLIASSATLHLATHADAGGAGHQCAVTLIAQGKFILTPVPDLGPAPENLVLRGPSRGTSIDLPTAPRRLPPDRGPPLLCPPHTRAG
jgi:hypothetical protein